MYYTVYCYYSNGYERKVEGNLFTLRSMINYRYKGKRPLVMLLPKELGGEFFNKCINHRVNKSIGVVLVE